jgi:hypothetical protein
VRHRDVRHTLTSLLLTAVAAALAGARSFAAAGEWAADAPPQVVTAPGVQRDPLTGRFCPPDEATIRRAWKPWMPRRWMPRLGPGCRHGCGPSARSTNTARGVGGGGR